MSGNGIEDGFHFTSENPRRYEAVPPSPWTPTQTCDVPAGYMKTVVQRLSAITGIPVLEQSSDLFDAAQNTDDILAVSAGLDLLARQLMKVSADLRLLNSGPAGGLKEIDLPALQAGSSIMPGKVNPVIPEYVMQLSMQATGLHHASATALAHAELDLNIWESLITCNTLDMMGLLATSMTSLADSAIDGLRVMTDNNLEHLKSPIPEWTELAKQSGYANVSAQIGRMTDRQARDGASDDEGIY